MPPPRPGPHPAAHAARTPQVRARPHPAPGGRQASPLGRAAPARARTQGGARAGARERGGRRMQTFDPPWQPPARAEDARGRAAAFIARTAARRSQSSPPKQRPPAVPGRAPPRARRWALLRGWRVGAWVRHAEQRKHRDPCPAPRRPTGPAAGAAPSPTRRVPGTPRTLAAPRFRGGFPGQVRRTFHEPVGPSGPSHPRLP